MGFPGQRATVPAHLKQGVLHLLGTGLEVDAAGGFAQTPAAKTPDALERIKRGEVMEALQENLLPRFRALLVARILSVADASLYNFESREIGDYAELGLWLLEGLPKELARAAQPDKLTKRVVDPLFEKLIDLRLKPFCYLSGCRLRGFTSCQQKQRQKQQKSFHTSDCAFISLLETSPFASVLIRG